MITVEITLKSGRTILIENLYTSNLKDWFRINMVTSTGVLKNYFEFGDDELIMISSIESIKEIDKDQKIGEKLISKSNIDKAIKEKFGVDSNLEQNMEDPLKVEDMSEGE